MHQKYEFLVSPYEILSVKSFGLTLFNITAISLTFPLIKHFSCFNLCKTKILCLATCFLIFGIGNLGKKI